MLKISSTESAKPRKDGVGVSGDSRAGHGKSEIDRIGIDDVEIDGGGIEVDEIWKKVQKLSKSNRYIKLCYWWNFQLANFRWFDKICLSPKRQ